MNIVPVGAEHVEGLVAFFGRLPERDLTFIQDDVDRDAIRTWPDRAVQQWIAIDGDGIAGYVAVRPLVGWSDHVGELRLVVDPERRRIGIGRALAKHAVLEAVRAGRRKLVVELAADQEGALNMFSSLGFEGEALLRDHIRDRHGELRDLVMLAHFVDGNWAALEAVGIADEVGAGR
jgi:ribosomal protein S18 acetylase RimI-like enzyme